MKKPKVLRKLVVTEVSSVTRAANPGAQILLMKRDDGSAAPKATETPSQVSSHVGHLADLIVEAGGGRVSRAEAISFLLSTPAGQAIIRTTKRETPEKEQQPMEQVHAIVKNFGLVGVAKAMVDQQRDFGISESEFTELVLDHAKLNKRDGESAAGAFSRIFTAGTEDGALLRKAHQLTKNAALQATQVGAEDALDTNTDASAAYQQLVDMAEKLRASAPFLSVSQAFERSFTASPELAAKAHRRPAPTTSFAFPR